MANLSDYIEEHLKKLLALSSRNYVDIQRRELARKFTCVPSQINYVLDSRFNLESGYLVESKRGGGGYIRIYRVDPNKRRFWKEAMEKIADGGFNPARVTRLIKRCYEERLLTRREAQMLEVLLADDHYAGLLSEPDQLRALQQKLFIAALEAILKESF